MQRIDIDIARVTREIDALFATVPELSDDEQLRADMIDGETDATEIMRRIVREHLDAKAQAAALKEVEASYKARRDRIEARADAFRSMAHRLLDAARLGKLPLPEATLSISPGRASVLVTDESVVPPRFTRTKTEIDKAAIREALSLGEHVPGAVLSNGGETLTIRTK